MADSGQITYNYGSIENFHGTLQGLTSELGSAIENIKGTHNKVAASWDSSAHVKHAEVGQRLDTMFADHQQAVQALGQAVSAAGTHMQGADAHAAAGYAG